MTPIPFDPATDLAPIPFDNRICRLGRELKDKGLTWRPHVGCFVWDPEGLIQSPSPFPNRIYFVLSLPRFLDIFGTVENMVAKLIWLPTMHQARTLCRQLGLRDHPDGSDIYRLYHHVGEALAGIGRTEKFIKLAVKTQLGDISDLPPDLVDHVGVVYREFVTAYIDMLRQKESRPTGWFPDKWSLDLELADDMRHFYSDHQFITRKFFLLNAGIRQLRKIDPDRQDKLYRDSVDELLQKPRQHADVLQ